MHRDDITPYGFCHCGCGQRTRVSPCTVRREGRYKGVPRMFVQGHNARGPIERYTIDAVTGCWVWPKLSRLGYGEPITRNGVPKKPHVFFYERKHGPVPDGLELDHICPHGPNRACCNPEHLEPVTRTENVRRSKVAKLTKSDVVRIRLLLGTMLQREIGQMFGVSVQTISAIKTGQVWRD